MELIVISESKLKIMMTLQDMKEFEFSGSSISNEDLRSRRAFRNILAEAKLRTGFDTGNERVYVQLYPSKCGGCELFITKLGLLSHTDPSEDTIPSRRAAHLCEIRHSPRPNYYRFRSLHDLLSTCECLMATDYPGDSSAFAGESDFFLMIDAESPAPSEFNGTLCKPYITEYIAEHCRCLCTNAVQVLGRLS